MHCPTWFPWAADRLVSRSPDDVKYGTCWAARKLLCGGGMAWAPGEGGGGGFQKWASVPGPLFCVWPDVATKGAGTQILARKIFFHEKIFPTYV